MRKSILVTAMLVVSLGFGIFLFADEVKPEARRSRRPSRPVARRQVRPGLGLMGEVRLYNQLDLTKEQRKELSAVRKELREKIKAALDNAKKKSEAVLTDEQKAKLAKLREEQKTRREEMQKQLRERGGRGRRGERRRRLAMESDGVGRASQRKLDCHWHKIRG